MKICCVWSLHFILLSSVTDQSTLYGQQNRRRLHTFLAWALPLPFFDCFGWTVFDTCWHIKRSPSQYRKSALRSMTTGTLKAWRDINSDQKLQPRKRVENQLAQPTETQHKNNTYQNNYKKQGLFRHRQTKKTRHKETTVCDEKDIKKKNKTNSKTSGTNIKVQSSDSVCARRRTSRRHCQSSGYYNPRSAFHCYR